MVTFFMIANSLGTHFLKHASNESTGIRFSVKQYCIYDRPVVAEIFYRFDKQPFFTLFG